MRKSLKKVLAGVCCLTLFCGLAACSKTKEEPTGGKHVTVTTEPTQTPEATVTTVPMTTPEATKIPEATKEPTETPEPTAAPTDIPEEEGTIMAAAEKLGFSFGTGVGAWDSKNLDTRIRLMEDFNSLTATNEMKAYSLLDQNASRFNPSGMPVMDYSQADEIVSMAELLGIGVRGHVLVWDAYMVDWFFREDYSSDGAFVDRETMLVRLEYYIDQVITHFETEFPGVVYCWDVVNEAVGDSEEDYDASDARHVRTVRGDVDNYFYEVIGSDYIELSFLYASNTVEKLKKQNPETSITLFYNDYNTFHPEKRDAICEVVKSINSYAKNADGTYRKLCEGVGMQSYIGGYGEQEGCMNPEDIELIRTAILKYHALGVEVHVTEMAVRNYDAERIEDHAQFYADLFQMYAEVNAEEPVVTNISIWGLVDNPDMDEYNYSYKQNSPYCGLWDENNKKKDAYYNVLAVLEQAAE